MTYQDIVDNITCLCSNGDLSESINGKIRLDSNMVNPGDIFVAVKGNKVDGIDYVEDAIKKGAKCIIAQKTIVVPENIIFILVPNTIDCLLDLAWLIRLRYKNIPLIAITGSVGKTMTKELVSSMLSQKYKVLKTEGEQECDEGCLSFPNKYAKVKRPEKVVVEGLNEKGKKTKIKAEGLLAEALLHEIDHLDGKLFIDIVEPGTLEVVTPKKEEDE